MKRNSFTLLICYTFIAFLSSCSEENVTYTFPYNTNNISDRRFLPEELHEISGLSLLTGTTHDLACVQDEAGIIYIFDLLRSNLKNGLIYRNPMILKRLKL